MWYSDTPHGRYDEPQSQAFPEIETKSAHFAARLWRDIGVLRVLATRCHNDELAVMTNINPSDLPNNSNTKDSWLTESVEAGQQLMGRLLASLQ